MPKVRDKLVFDFNGTLVKTKVNQLKSWKKTFEDFSLKNKYFLHVEEGINNGLSSFQIASKITSSNELIVQLIKSKRTYFKTDFKNNYDLFYNQKNILNLLSKDFDLYILSLTNIEFINNWLLKTKLDKCFKKIYARNDISQNIDKNELLVQFVQKNNLPLFYIGDTIKDYEIAKNNHISFIRFNVDKEDNNSYKKLYDYIIRQ
jgi:phosphoglycolate phosphatase-like HAD superfamily hydrolase